MLKYLFLTFTTLGFLVIPCTGQQRQSNSASLVGTYYIGHNFGGSTLVLNADGSYEKTSHDCTTEYFQSGSYVLSAKGLRFQIRKYTASGNGSNVEMNLLDLDQLKEVFGKDSKAIETEFDLVPVRWSDRSYLIDVQDLGNFANAINLGLEPRARLSAEPYYGSFYLRSGDERKKVSGYPELPQDWLLILLKKPVTGTVVAVRGEADATLITIDKGRKNGLRAGMRLLAQNEEPSLWGGAQIVSVTNSSAIVRTGRGITLGDKLTTKYISRFYR